MNYRILEVKALDHYQLELHFSDGLTGKVDLSDLVGDGVFKAWENPKIFAQVSINPTTHTVCWPGDIDLAPEALYEDIKRQNH